MDWIIKGDEEDSSGDERLILTQRQRSFILSGHFYRREPG